MTRPRTPAERHERELDRMAPGGDYDASAPVRRQGPKGKVVPRRPSDETPMPVVEGVGAPGGSGDLSDAEHDHPFALYDAVATKVDPGGAGTVGQGLPVRGSHTHGLDLSALTPQPITDDPGAPGATGEVPDAGHKHHFDPVAAGIPAWDVDATPDTLGLRSATGTMSVAPPSAPAHAIPNSETSVPPTADTIGRRTAEGTLEVADATSALHAVNLQTGDGRYASLTALADHEAAEGEGVHGATSSSTGVSQIMARNADGEVFISATTPGASTSVLSRQMGDGRYLEMSTGISPQVIGNRVRTPFGTEAGPGLEVGEAGTGLSGAANRLDLATDGLTRMQVGAAGVRPATAGLPLGITGQRWGSVKSDGVIETSHDDDGATSAIRTTGGAGGVVDFGGAVLARGTLYAAYDETNPGSGTVVDEMGRVYADQFLTYGNVDSGGAATGMALDPKGGSVQAVNVDTGALYPMEASEFDTSSDRAGKMNIRPAEDELGKVLTTPVRRYQRIRHKLERRPASRYGHPPELIAVDELEDTPEQLGLVADEAPADIVVRMTNGEGGISLYGMTSMLWRAFQQSHESTTARLDALESR